MAKVFSVFTLKTVREALCYAQTNLPDTEQSDRYTIVLSNLIQDIDMQRPLGSDGTHGDLHTDWCGCGG